MTVSIANVSAGQARSYYDKDDLDRDLDSKREDFYAAYWHGKGAAELGLHRAIEPQQFQQVLQGISLEGKWLQGKPIDPENHRAGTDITISAPKSVSLAALVQNDRRLVLAHDRAVQTVLDVAEARYVQARRWNAEASKQEKVLTGNLASATFRHVTSRNNDAQLHSHCVTLNATQDGGRWKAVSNELIAQNQRSLDRIYMNDLAHKVQELGYQIERKAGARFELRGYSQEALRAFSSRRVEIEQAVSDSGDQPNARNFQKHTLHTRARKRSTSESERRDKWDRMLEEYQLKLPSIPQEREPEQTNAEQVVQKHIARLTDQQSAFSREELERSILEADLGRCKFADITQAIDHAPQLVQYADLLTTPAHAQRLIQLETLIGLDDAPHQTWQAEATRRIAEPQTDRDCAGSLGSRIAERLAATLPADCRPAEADRTTTTTIRELNFGSPAPSRSVDESRGADEFLDQSNQGSEVREPEIRQRDSGQGSGIAGLVEIGNRQDAHSSDRRSDRHHRYSQSSVQRSARSITSTARTENREFGSYPDQIDRRLQQIDGQLWLVDQQLEGVSSQRAERRRQEAERQAEQQRQYYALLAEQIRSSGIQLFEHYAASRQAAYTLPANPSEHIYRVEQDGVFYLVSRDDASMSYNVRREDTSLDLQMRRGLTDQDAHLWQKIQAWLDEQQVVYPPETVVQQQPEPTPSVAPIPLSLQEAASLSVQDWLSLSPRQQITLAEAAIAHLQSEPRVWIQAETWRGEEAHIHSQMKDLKLRFQEESTLLKKLEARGERSFLNPLGANAEEIESAQYKVQTSQRSWDSYKRDLAQIHSRRNQRQEQEANYQAWAAQPDAQGANRIQEILQDPVLRSQYQEVAHTAEQLKKWEQQAAPAANRSASDLEQIALARQGFLDGGGIPDSYRAAMKKDLDQYDSQRQRQLEL